MHPFGRNKHGPKIKGSAPFWGGGCVHIEHKNPWAEAYLHAKCHLDP